MNPIELINKYAIGAILPPMLILCGVYFCIKLRFFHLRHPIALLSVALGRSRAPGRRDAPSPLSALCMALAGTLGTGNIVGVALAIVSGGPGAIFWMWISAFAAMTIKYAETLLAIDTRVILPSGERRGGAMYYIRGRSCASRTLAAIFALLCIAEALTVGSGIQASATSECAEGLLGIPSWITGCTMAALTAAVIFGGTKKIASVTTLAVPLMTLGYTLISLWAIIANREALPEAIGSIFAGAFNGRAAVGGVLGFLLSPALRFGVSRGLLSNEAGCGTAPAAHAASSEDDPARQGALGIVEVFVDTILLCTLTALVILTSGVALEGGGALVTVRAFEVTLGAAAPPTVTLMIFVFAWATMLCQAFYGGVCVGYLGLGERARRLFGVALCASALICSVAPSETVWAVADLAIGVMALINLSALLRRSGRICRLSEPLLERLGQKKSGCLTNE